MTAQIPTDASINVQNAIKTLNTDIRTLKQQVDAINQAPPDPDIAALKSSVTKLAKVPTFQTWEDVHGSFPRYENLFAAFLLTKSNIGTGEQSLAIKVFSKFELPISRTLRVIFWGATASNANVKTIFIRLLEGANSFLIAQFTPTVSEAGRWIIAIRLERVSSASIRAVCLIISGPSGSPTTYSIITPTQPTISNINDFSLNLSGSATADSDITVSGGVIPRIENTLALFSTTVGSSGASETALAEKILTNILLNDGDTLRGAYWGKTVNNANAKTLRFHVIEGANDTTIIALTLTISQAGNWFLGFHIKRASSTTFRAGVQAASGATAVVDAAVNAASGTATWANAVTLRLTGQATTTGDITCEGGIIPAVGNMISSFQATVSSSGASETTLAEKILDVSGGATNLGTDGRTIRGVFWGKTVSNVNVKTLRVRIIEGGNNTVIITSTPAISETGQWLIGFELERVDATTLKTTAQVCSGPANSMNNTTSDNAVPPATLANAITIRVTGQATTTGDITLEGGTLSFEV